MSNEVPLACDLTAIDKTERPLHKQNGESVFEAVLQVEERSNGYAFRLPAETGIIERAGAFVARERLCCPFFHFALEVTPGHGPVWLKLTGSKDVKQFVAHNVMAQIDSEVNGLNCNKRI